MDYDNGIGFVLEYTDNLRISTQSFDLKICDPTYMQFKIHSIDLTGRGGGGHTCKVSCDMSVAVCKRIHKTVFYIMHLFMLSKFVFALGIK